MSNDYYSDDESAIIQSAIRILENRAVYTEGSVTSPDVSKDYLFMRLANRKNEHFSVMFLNNKHEIIEYKEMFHGTIDGASVYPRVVAQKALEVNAAAVILGHNHPSGDSTPSQSDIWITERLKDALLLFDIRVLDHIVVGDSADTCSSMAELGQI